MRQLWIALILAVQPCAAGAETLRIATDATFPPFHFLDDAGSPTGFDVELARAVAERAGFDVELLVVEYDQLFTGLSEGSHDLVAATTGITADRQQRFLFSNAYFETCQAAVVRTGFDEPLHVRELSELRIGASGSGTSYSAMLETLSAAQLSIADGEGPEALSSRRIDAWIVDEFDAVAAARGSHGTFAVLPEPVALERYGFVMNHRDEVRLERINDALDALRQNGELQRLQRRYGVQRDAEWPLRN